MPAAFVRICVTVVPIALTLSFNWSAGADIAIAVLIVPSLALMAQDRDLRTRPVIVLSLGWIAFVALCAYLASMGDAPGQHWGQIGKHLPIALGPLAAISLGKSCARLQIRPDAAALLMLLGVVMGATVLLLRNDALQLVWEQPFPFEKSSVGAINRNYAAFSAGLSLIALASLLHLTLTTRWPALFRIAVSAGLAALLGGLSILLIIVQSRAAYLATALGVAVWLAVVLGKSMRKDAPFEIRISWIGPALMVAALFGLAMIYAPVVGKRFATSGLLADNIHVVWEIILGRGDGVMPALRAMEERFQLYAVAADLIYQKPLLGWGPDVSRLIERFSPFPGLRNMNQFHNGYIQHLVSFGLVGAILMLALIVAILREVWLARGTPAGGRSSEGAGSPEFSAATAAAMAGMVVYVMLFNVTESILLVKPAATVTIILVALACMRRQIAVPAPNPTG